MNFSATRVSCYSPRYYRSTSPPKLCVGSLDTPAKSLITMGFCGHCHVRVYLNEDGAAKRHYETTGVRPNASSS